MGRLKRQAKKSSIMDFEIEDGKRVVRFNLAEELRIDDSDMNTDLMSQPQIYAYLTMLRQAYTKRVKEAEQDKEKALSKAIERQMASQTSEYYKERNSYVPASMAKDLAKKDPFYIKASKRLIELEDTRNRLNNAVEAFEQRGSLLQTLSANMRKERA